MLTFRNILILLTLISAITGCSFVERNTIGLLDADEAGQPVKLEELSDAAEDVEPSNGSIAPAPTNRVEILWEIPEQPVDEYIIRYGYSRDRLEFVDTIAFKDLVKLEDPTHGEVFHHYLSNVPADKTVYVTLESIRDGKVSDPTKVFVVGTLE